MARKKTEAEFDQEVNRIHNMLGVGGRVRTTIDVARHFLKLDGPLFWNGRAFRVKSKSVGCGIYELTSEDWT